MKVKLKTTIIIGILVFILSMASTYAYLSYSVTNDVVIKGNIVNMKATLNVELVSGTNNEMVPMMDNALNNAINGTGGTSACVDSKGNLSCQVYKITLTNEGSTLKNLKGTIELYATNGGVYNNLKWQELSSTTSVKEGSTSNGMAKSTLVSGLTLKPKEVKTWYIGVWISEKDTDQTNTDKGKFGGTVTFEVSNGEIATDLVEEKYNSGTKTSITTAGGEAITQVVSEGLMQDSFGNIRYYGTDPDNYVTFNGESAGWRIIGVFDTEDENGNVSKRIKLIRATSIGSYAYDNKPSGTGTSTSSYGSNDWTDARLMMLLNPGYEEISDLYAYEGSLYWNRKSGTCYAGSSEGTTSCDFTSTGLTTSAQSQIDKVKYYLGGNNTAAVYADDYYNFERGTTVYSGHSTSWNGYIGIMYPSDYTYATDLSVCTQNGNNYEQDTTNCIGKDWLFNSAYQWTMSPSSGYAYKAFYVHSRGYVNNNNHVFGAAGVRPVAYLKSDIQILNGSGKQSDPYIIG